jgi:hypothetical protein
LNIEFAHHSPSINWDFQTDVLTVLPFHVTSRGRPKFAESNLGIRISSKFRIW